MDADSTRSPESRLDEIRESAKLKADQVQTPLAFGWRADRAKTAGTVGYYNQPILKSPVWTWKVSLYFLVSGVAGMAALLTLAVWCRLQFFPWKVESAFQLIRSCAWIAAISAVLCAILLVWELGRPARFLYMLRVFKWRSPMSMAAWILVAFGSCAALMVVGVEQAGELEALCVPTLSGLIGAGLTGGILATCSGVLLSASVIPIWHAHRRSLPAHFGLAGMASALSVLMLMGHVDQSLLRLGICVAAIDLLHTLILALKPNDAVNLAVRRGRAGWQFKIAIQLTGPVAIILWSTDSVRFGAVCFLLGNLISHFAWLGAGRVSANDPLALFESQENAAE